MNCIGQRQHQVPTCAMHRKMKTLPAITYATSGKQFRILDYTAQYNGAHAVNLLIIIRAVGSGQWAVADIMRVFSCYPIFQKVL